MDDWGEGMRGQSLLPQTHSLSVRLSGSRLGNERARFGFSVSGAKTSGMKQTHHTTSVGLSQAGRPLVTSIPTIRTSLPRTPKGSQIWIPENHAGNLIRCGLQKDYIYIYIYDYSGVILGLCPIGPPFRSRPFGGF